jgi:ubiquinone biosynthesis monooxygenase Coq7
VARRHRTLAERLPGDPSREAAVAAMIRVDHAGEYGARRIYEGQLAVLGDTPEAAPIRRMAEQEQRHLDAFDKLVVERRVRPTALAPLWHAAGFALGAATALLGPRAAMACTEAVESVIDEHYARQAERLGADEPALRAAIEEFRADEIEHKETAIAHGAADAPAHEALTTAIKAGTRLAIWLSTRV